MARFASLKNIYIREKTWISSSVTRHSLVIRCLTGDGQTTALAGTGHGPVALPLWDLQLNGVS